MNIIWLAILNQMMVILIIHKDETDFAIIKLKIPELLNKDSAVCNMNGFVPVQDTLRDACGYDSVIVNYEPVFLSGPFDNIRKADTIFAGQSIDTFINGNGTITWNPFFIKLYQLY